MSLITTYHDSGARYRHLLATSCSDSAHYSRVANFAYAPASQSGRLLGNLVPQRHKQEDRQESKEAAVPKKRDIRSFL
eukprot:COSAG01_NODE_9047_length_2570_cov_44.923917_2_plen_78_part_00